MPRGWPSGLNGFVVADSAYSVYRLINAVAAMRSEYPPDVDDFIVQFGDVAALEVIPTTRRKARSNIA
jgi:hypothetical protein